MRVAMLMVIAGALLCSCDEAPPRSGDGTLVLELGGNHGSLRRALLAAGVVIEPRPFDGRPIDSLQQLLGAEVEPVRVDPVPIDPVPIDPVPIEPPPDPEPRLRYRLIELGVGETISHLARRHLGSVGRYGEILELNGWTELQSRSLPAGTTVKVPLE